MSAGERRGVSPPVGSFKCNKDVPCQDFTCPHCGYRFEAGE